MKKLGYIISPIRIKNVADFIEITDNMDKFESEMPAMIIGLKAAKEHIKDFSILRKRYGDDKFWTFGKTERRIDFEKDVEMFYNYVLSKKIKDLKYVYVDVLTFPKNRLRSMMRFFLSSVMKYLYIYKGMLYVYSGKNVFGLSMTLLNYCGVDSDKWLKKIARSKSVRVHYNDNGISTQIKHYVKNKRYLIPYFYSLMD